MLVLDFELIENARIKPHQAIPQLFFLEFQRTYADFIFGGLRNSTAARTRRAALAQPDVPTLTPALTRALESILR